MARTGEEKIERDDHDEKGREPEGVVEVEEAHECTATVWQRSSARLEEVCAQLAANGLSLRAFVPAHATMYHLLKGLHEYLTRSEACSHLSSSSKLSRCNSQEGRVFRHYHRTRRRGQDGAHGQATRK